MRDMLKRVNIETNVFILSRST